jgi:hypothetical protein
VEKLEEVMGLRSSLRRGLYLRQRVQLETWHSRSLALGYLVGETLLVYSLCCDFVNCVIVPGHRRYSCWFWAGLDFGDLIECRSVGERGYICIVYMMPLMSACMSETMGLCYKTMEDRGRQRELVGTPRHGRREQ